VKVKVSPRPLICQALRGFDVWRVVTALLLALTNLPLVIAQNQSAAVEQYNRANVLLKEGDLAGAQLEIEKVLKEFPNVPEALNLAGIISEVQGEHQQAIDYFKRALSARSNYFDARSNLAYAYLETNQYESGLLEFEEVLKGAPHHVGANLGVAQTLYKTGRFADALKAVHHTLTLSPENPDALLLAVKVKFQLKLVEEAVESGRKFRLMFSDNRSQLAALGVVLLDNGQ